MAGGHTIIRPVIISGGSGTRLWPLSTPQHPKQFLQIFDGKSLFQETLLRVKNTDIFDTPLILASANHAHILKDQSKDIAVNAPSFLLEPVGRNTAPAIAVAALSADRDDQLLLVLPADHKIVDTYAFEQAVIKAADIARKGYICCFGIVPDRPDTNYGYIQSGEALDPMVEGFYVHKFREKPDTETAKAFLASGNFNWNSGMFLFPAGLMLDELRVHAPDIVDSAQKAYEARDSQDVLDAHTFSDAPGISIDYAVLEKTDRAAVLPARFDWTDLGSFSALCEVFEQDKHGNVVLGQAELRDCSNCFVYNDAGHLGIIGQHDKVIIVSDGNKAILDKVDDQRVREIAKA